MYSDSINKLISSLRNLPSVGQHTAERFVFHWLKSGKKEVTELMLALKNLTEKVKSCEVCWNFSDNNPCPICTDKTRRHDVICVVSEPQAIPAMEKTGEYKGVYHVLRGTIEAVDPAAINSLKINELIARAKDKKVIEIILALNPDLPGETTMMYLEKQLAKFNPKLKITRLARGLPTGSDLQYTDEITLGSALKHRY